MADQGGAYGCGVAAGGCGGCGEDSKANAIKYEKIMKLLRLTAEKESLEISIIMMINS